MGKSAGQEGMGIIYSCSINGRDSVQSILTISQQGEGESSGKGEQCSSPLASMAEPEWPAWAKYDSSSFQYDMAIIKTRLSL